jgi:thiol reductant ABC exporter CydC subunit
VIRAVALVRPAGGRVALAALLGAGAACAAVGLLATSAWLIARAAQHPGASALGVAIAGVQFFALSRGLLRYAERLVGHDAAFRALATLRVTVYRRLEPLAPAALPTFREGDLLARFVHDVDALQDLLLRVVQPFAIAVIGGGATVALLWWLLPAAGAIAAVTLLLATTVVPWVTARPTGRPQAREELSAAAVEAFEGAPELRVNGALPERLRTLERLDAELARDAAAAARAAGAGHGLVTLLTGLALWGVVAAATRAQLDPVTLTVVALVPLVLLELFVALPAATQALSQVRRSAARVQDVLDAPAPLREPRRPRPLPEVPVLRVRGLRARYGDAWVLEGVDLDLAPGRRVAVIGPSGAGKSTLAAVLLRFLDYEGSVTLGGVELRALDAAAVRTAIGLVAQDAHVFDTTLHENLRLARRGATESELEAALALARLTLDLEAEGGPGGHRFSGGERRRIALARAELARFPLLILDEPGEHLDARTADAIVGDALQAGRGTLLITHRLAGLEAVDEIIVLEAGRVAERGTHAELLRRGGRYAESWTRARNTR